MNLQENQEFLKDIKIFSSGKRFAFDRSSPLELWCWSSWRSRQSQNRRSTFNRWKKKTVTKNHEKKSPKNTKSSKLSNFSKYLSFNHWNTEISSCKRSDRGFQLVLATAQRSKRQRQDCPWPRSKGFFGFPTKQEMAVFRMSAIFKGSLALEGSYNLQWIPQLLLSLLKVFMDWFVEIYYYDYNCYDWSSMFENWLRTHDDVSVFVSLHGWPSLFFGQQGRPLLIPSTRDVLICKSPHPTF